MTKATMHEPKKTHHEDDVHEKSSYRRRNGHYTTHASANENWWDNIKEKSSDFAENVKKTSNHVAKNIKSNPTTKSLLDYAKANKKEAVIGGLMILGFLFSFYWLGSFIVGLAAAFYVPWNFKTVWNTAVRFYEREGGFPAFMLGVGLLFMLFHVFSFVIGGLVGLILKTFTTQDLGIGSHTEVQDVELTDKEKYPTEHTRKPHS